MQITFEEASKDALNVSKQAWLVISRSGKVGLG